MVGRIADVLKLSRITRNILFVLVDHRRIALLSPIVAEFEQVIDARLGFARAEVSSPGELNEAQRRALNTQLERLTGKRIRMRFAIDPSLIGGAVARIGSTVYDGSVRGQLAHPGAPSEHGSLIERKKIWLIFEQTKSPAFFARRSKITNGRST